jgi:hypothetical protein
LRISVIEEHLNPVIAHNPENAGQVRMLIVAISVMTLAMAFILGLIAGRLLSPGGREATPHTLNLANLPVQEVRLAPGETLARTDVAYDRAMIITDRAGITQTYLLPLDQRRAVRLVILPAE